MTRMYIHRTPTGAGNKAVTWAFGSPADLEEANRLLSEKFDTEPVSDPRGMAAIEIRHPEFAAGTAEPMVLLDDIFRCWVPLVSRASPCVMTRAPLVPEADSLGRCAHHRRGLQRSLSSSAMTALSQVPPGRFWAGFSRFSCLFRN